MRALEGGGAQRDMVLPCNVLAAKGIPTTILTLRADRPLRHLFDPGTGAAEVAGPKPRYAVPGLRRAVALAAARVS
jgi:hypothetical protein